MIRAVTVAALALTFVPSAPAAQGAARAPEATPPATPPSGAPPPSASPGEGRASPSAERVARALTTRPSWGETVDSYASSLSAQISAAVKAQGGDAPADVQKRVRGGLDEAVGYEEVVRLQAQALGGRFSEDELRTIARFYESAPGKKLVSELPAVSRQVIAVVQQRISAAIPRIVEEVAPSLARAKPGAAGEGAKERPPQVQGREPPAESSPPPRR